MIRTLSLVTLLSLAAPPLAAQPVAPPPVAAPVEAPVPATVRVSLVTSEGAIVLALEKERAPITTANFLRYVDGKRLDGAVFYRAMKLSDEPLYGLVQGGAENKPKRVLPPIAHEPTTITGLSHKDGTISMARGAPGTASGDFFITVGDLVSLDAKSGQPGDDLGFAAFGHVVEGMDVVRRILVAPTSPTAGGEGMKGQMIAAPVTIVSARRAD